MHYWLERDPRSDGYNSFEALTILSVNGQSILRLWLDRAAEGKENRTKKKLDGTKTTPRGERRRRRRRRRKRRRRREIGFEGNFFGPPRISRHVYNTVKSEREAFKFVFIMEVLPWAEGQDGAPRKREERKSDHFLG